MSFDEFWKACPRKIAKVKAKACYDRAIDRHGVSQETLVSAMKAFAAVHAQEGTPPQFICHPTTWLNEGRWDDDLSGYQRRPEPPLPNDKRAQRARDIEALNTWDFSHLDQNGKFIQ